jgi:transposase
VTGAFFVSNIALVKECVGSFYNNLYFANKKEKMQASSQWIPRQNYQPPDIRSPAAPTSQTAHQQPQLDPKIQQQYMAFLHHATAAQFKLIKLYVLFNDPTSVSCIQLVRANSDLDRQVEVIDAAPPGNRPNWLKGVPSLVDEKGQFFLGIRGHAGPLA